MHSDVSLLCSGWDGCIRTASLLSLLRETDIRESRVGQNYLGFLDKVRVQHCEPLNSSKLYQFTMVGERERREYETILMIIWALKKLLLFDMFGVPIIATLAPKYLSLKPEVD